jgi:NitT/TauT family transport system ATP-binding protein
VSLAAQAAQIARESSHPDAAPAGIDVRGVTHVFNKGAANEFLALDDVSLTVARGELHCLLGPSGCGKSTLLYLIGGFIPTQSGRIATPAGEVRGPGPDRGVVFQSFALFPWLTVRDNVLYGLRKTGMPRREQEERAQAYIELVHLRGFEQAYPAQLSGGMQQRAAIARTLAVDPDILLMDEPFGALDAQTRRLMQEELLRIWKDSRKTIVFVTHDVQEAVFLADRVSVMSARPGRIADVVAGGFNRSDDPHVTRTKQFAERAEELWDLVRLQAERQARDSGARP